MQSELLREDQQRQIYESQRLDGQIASGSGRPVMETERLLLRTPHINDTDALAHLANNFKVAAMLSRMPHPYTLQDADDFVTRARTGAISNCIYAITKKHDGAFIGCCAAEPHDGQKTVELGYWLGEPYWNNGYCTEAAHALVDLAFSNPVVERIDARCRVMNVASKRVLQKCGFQFQGSGMSPSLSLGGSMAVDWYRLDRKTFEALRNWRVAL